MFAKISTRSNAKRLTLLIILPAIAFCCAPIQAQSQYRGLNAQRDAVMGTGGSSNTGSRYTGPSQSEIAAQQAAAAQQQRDTAATAQKNEGLAAFKKQDWATAASDFQNALQNNPNDQTIKDNLAAAQQKLKEQQDNKTAANNIQQIVQNFTQSLNNSSPVPSVGLNFDGTNSGITPNPNNGATLDFMSADSASNPPIPATPAPPPKPALEFGDPMVVDARNVPSALPKAMDDAIAVAFPNSIVPLHAGFKAVMAQDWQTARACFGDAVNHDPNNIALRRMAALVGYVDQNHPVSNNPQQTKAVTKAIFENVNGVDDAILNKITDDAVSGLKPPETGKASDPLSPAAEAKFDDIMLKKIQDDAIAGLAKPAEIHN